MCTSNVPSKRDNLSFQIPPPCLQARLLFTDWTVAKPCLLLLIQHAFDVLCGGLVLAQYAPGIFQTVVASLSAAQCSQLLAALQVRGSENDIYRTPSNFGS